MTVEVPGGFEELSDRWLDGALRDGGLLDVTVEAVEVEPTR